MNLRKNVLKIVLLIMMTIGCLHVTASADDLYKAGTAVSADQRSKAATITNVTPKITGCYNSVKGADINWQKVSGAKGYYIYRNRKADGGNKRVATVYGESTVRYYDGDIRVGCFGNVYVYTVVAFDSYGRVSKKSNAVTLQRLAPMKFTKYYAKSANIIGLAWECTVSSNKAAGYEIQYARSTADLFARNGTFKAKTVDGRSSLAAVVSDLIKNTTYYFRIRAYVYYTHTGTGVTTKTWSQYSDVVSVKTLSANKPVYRALLIGNRDYYDSDDSLGGPVNDAAAMAGTLQKYGYSTTIKKNRTGAQMLSDIRSAFTGATSSDVSLFFYSGHGATNTGSLVSVDYTFVSLQKLAELLSAVPGKVVVILDSCGSGGGVANVGSSAGGAGSAAAFSPALFNRQVINAFAAADPGISVSQGVSGDADVPMVGYGELRTSKFLVLTASAANQASSDLMINGIWGGALTRTIVQGAGCSFPSGSWNGGWIPADKNSDNKLTLNELYTYSSSNVMSRQTVSCYPTGSSSVVMAK